MPHVIVRLWPGKSEEQKKELATAITNDVTRILGYGEDAVSVAMDEVSPSDWKEKVYQQDIIANGGKLYKKPGYTY